MHNIQQQQVVQQVSSFVTESEYGVTNVISSACV